MKREVHLSKMTYLELLVVDLSCIEGFNLLFYEAFNLHINLTNYPQEPREIVILQNMLRQKAETLLTVIPGCVTISMFLLILRVHATDKTSNNYVCIVLE